MAQSESEPWRQKGTVLYEKLRERVGKEEDSEAPQIWAVQPIKSPKMMSTNEVVIMFFVFFLAAGCCGGNRLEFLEGSGTPSNPGPLETAYCRRERLAQ